MEPAPIQEDAEYPILMVGVPYIWICGDTYWCTSALLGGFDFPGVRRLVIFAQNSIVNIGIYVFRVNQCTVNIEDASSDRRKPEDHFALDHYIDWIAPTRHRNQGLSDKLTQPLSGDRYDIAYSRVLPAFIKLAT